MSNVDVSLVEPVSEKPLSDFGIDDEEIVAYDPEYNDEESIGALRLVFNDF